MMVWLLFKLSIMAESSVELRKINVDLLIGYSDLSLSDISILSENDKFKCRKRDIKT